MATARALYWEDGYAAYYPATGLPLVSARKDLERKARDWVADRDFRGLAPVVVSGTSGLFASAVGNADRVLGWARNDQLDAPSWNAAPLDDATISVVLPGDTVDGAWTVELTLPDEDEVVSVQGASIAGVLTFGVSRSFNRVAFAATRAAR